MSELNRRKRLKPTPKSQEELSNSYIKPYELAGVKKPPLKTFKRGEQISRRGVVADQKDSTKDYTVGLYDIDEAIQYYFNNVIRPNVIIAGQRTPVPVIYAAPEKWKAIQHDGFYRDKNQKAMVPLIVYNRTSITKNRSITNKLDANVPHLFKVFEKKYTKKNIYDNWTLLSNRTPVKEYQGVIMPDYVTIEYDCVVYTDYIEQQMNPIIESINFASDSYWGDPQRFMFRARIDTFSNVTEIIQDEDRAVRSGFKIIMNGYIIPETINRDLVNVGRYYSKAQVIIGLEATTTNPNNPEITRDRTVNRPTNPYSTFEGKDVNIFMGDQTVSEVSQDVLDYLNTNITKNSDSISGTDTAIFNNAIILTAPSPLDPTTKDDFYVFVHGQLVPTNLIVSITQVGTTTEVVLDTANLGFTLDSADTVTIVGKFDGSSDT